VLFEIEKFETTVKEKPEYVEFETEEFVIEPESR
jgi:hypothetical protein